MKKREYRIFPICLLLALAVCFLAACSSGKGGTQESPGGVEKYVQKYVRKCQWQWERCG